MTLSKREKLIVYVAGAVLSVFALDWFIVEPLLQARADAATQVGSARAELERGRGLFENSRRVNRRWSEMVRGQLQQNASSAESQMLNSLRDWAQGAGLALSSLKPDKSEKEKDFSKITFRATGTGNLHSVASFLYALQTAPIAVRVTDLKVASRKDGTDDLTIDLAVATIHLSSNTQISTPVANTTSPNPQAASTRSASPGTSSTREVER